MNANSWSMNYYSGFAKVSFDGFINENIFELNPKETNLVENLEVFHGVSKNPLNFQKDIYLCFLVKSKYDGVGNRHPIDLSIALDVSGSMSSIDDKNKDSRITLAKKGLKKLVSILDQKKDRVSLLTFNHEIQKLFTLNHKEDIETKFLNDIDAIRANGGTDLLEAVKVAIDNFSSDDTAEPNRMKRILCITDAIYSDRNNELYNVIKKCVEEKHISVTFMAIGSDSNLSLADKLCDFEGCNYFPIAKSEELESYLVTNFKNIFFPVANNTKINVSCKNKDVKFSRCLGGSNPSIETNANNASFFNLGSCFPSEIITIKENDEEKQYVKGGIVLLKIEANTNEKICFELNLSYETFNGKKSSQNYEYEIPAEQLEVNYFRNKTIQKAISIYYFTEVLNAFVEKDKKLEGDKGNQDELKKKEMEFIENAQSVRDYLKKNYVYNPNDKESKEHLEKYLSLITERYNTYNKHFCKIFNVYPVLTLW
mgnify:CR=1 FL=1